MIDEQLNQRFTQIVQAFEFMLQTSNKQAESIQALERTVTTLAEVTREHGEEIIRITREWEAYLRTIRPQ